MLGEDLLDRHWGTACQPGDLGRDRGPAMLAHGGEHRGERIQPPRIFAGEGQLRAVVGWGEVDACNQGCVALFRVGRVRRGGAQHHASAARPFPAASHRASMTSPQSMLSGTRRQRAACGVRATAKRLGPVPCGSCAWASPPGLMRQKDPAQPIAAPIRCTLAPPAITRNPRPQPQESRRSAQLTINAE